MSHPVLIVEDDADIRVALMDVLEEAGYQPVGAVNGLDALEKLRQGALKPCLIVLDLMMPIMDGRAFREQQLREPALASIPVVVCSAYREITDQTLRVAEFLRKPLDVDDLVEAVRRYCRPDAPSPA
jgi:CheY-like chemotaxis protein